MIVCDWITSHKQFCIFKFKHSIIFSQSKYVNYSASFVYIFVLFYVASRAILGSNFSQIVFWFMLSHYYNPQWLSVIKSHCTTFLHFLKVLFSTYIYLYIYIYIYIYICTFFAIQTCKLHSKFCCFICYILSRLSRTILSDRNFSYKYNFLLVYFVQN